MPRHHMRLSLVPPLLGVLICLTVNTPADAQYRRHPHSGVLRPARGFAGGNFTLGQGLGMFGDSVGAAYGGEGHLLLKLDRLGIIGLRTEAGFLTYAHERKRVPWGGTVGGRVNLNLTTSNDLLYATAGPQLMMPTGGVRPYVAAMAGISNFWTESGLEGTGSDEQFASSTNYRDAWKVAYSGAVGMYVPLKGGPRPTSLDVGVHYLRNGQRNWLKPGRIQDNPDNTITVFPISSVANVLTYRVGVTVGIF